MKRRFGACTTDGELTEKKIEKLFLANGFIKIMNNVFWGDEANIPSITEELDKEHIYYSICPI